jgi:hypothetical protein
MLDWLDLARGDPAMMRAPRWIREYCGVRIEQPIIGA